MRTRYDLAVPLLILLAAAPAMAQSPLPCTLAWDLPASAGGVDTKIFQCDVSTGADELVLTLTPDADLTGVTALEAQLHVRESNDGLPGPYPPLSSYWQLQPGGCRAGAYSVSTDFTGAPFASLPGLEDVVSGAPALATYEWPYSGDPIRAAMTITIPLAAPVTLVAGHRYPLCRVVFSHAHSVEPGACEGCCHTVGFASTAAVSQTGGAWVWPPDGAGVPSAPVTRAPLGFYSCMVTPAPARTWGEVKALYR
jgi:hypothetical protein